MVVSFVGTDYPTTVGQDGTWEVQMNCCDYLTDKVLTVVGESNTLSKRSRSLCVFVRGSLKEAAAQVV